MALQVTARNVAARLGWLGIILTPGKHLLCDTRLANLARQCNERRMPSIAEQKKGSAIAKNQKLGSSAASAIADTIKRQKAKAPPEKEVGDTGIAIQIE